MSLSKYVIGVDPDSKKHGVATYRNGRLAQLDMMSTIDVVEHAQACNMAIVSIEDVASNKFVYSRNTNTKAVQSNIAMKVGRCQQAQIELERLLEHFGVTVIRHKPQRGNWAKNKTQFERVTGWIGRSNEDTRSAAYFGYLEASK